jgi:hypothetical protein
VYLYEDLKLRRKRRKGDAGLLVRVTVGGHKSKNSFNKYFPHHNSLSYLFHQTSNIKAIYDPIEAYNSQVLN